MKVDLEVKIGQTSLKSPILTAAGTSGHGAELGAFGDLGKLGAITVKSLAVFPWSGNRPVRVAPIGRDMINSVGLQGPSIKTWSEKYLPGIEKCGAKAVVSIWGRNISEFREAAMEVSNIAEDSESIIAIEVNASCPNLENRKRIFSHDKEVTKELVSEVKSRSGYLPVWIKLSPNTPDIVDIGGAAVERGAEVLVLTNTLVGFAIDTDSGKPVLGNKYGGVSGHALHSVAVRAVNECRLEFPKVGIVGVGGVFDAKDAIEFMMAGANAVGIGTALFKNPRAPWKILNGMVSYCEDKQIQHIKDLNLIDEK